MKTRNIICVLLLIQNFEITQGRVTHWLWFAVNIDSHSCLDYEGKGAVCSKSFRFHDQENIFE